MRGKKSRGKDSLDSEGATASPRPSRIPKKKRSLWKKRSRKKGGVFALPLPKAPVAGDSEVPVVFRMVMQYVDTYGLDKLGLYQIATGKKMDQLRNRIDAGGADFWLEADDTLGRDDAALAAAGLVLSFLSEQPDPLLNEPDILAAELNTYRVGSDLTPQLAESALATISELSSRSRACLSALVAHANRVISHGASNGAQMLTVADLFSDPTGIRPELLAFFFAHAEELGLAEDPPFITREQYFAAVKQVTMGSAEVDPRVELPICEDVIPDDEEARMSAESKVLELSLARHHEAIKVAANRGEPYPESRMSDLMSVQRKLTQLKRSLKTIRSENNPQASANSNMMKQGEGASPRSILSRSTALTALEKQYGELLLEHDEHVAIGAVLKRDLDAENVKLNAIEVKVADLDLEPSISTTLAEISDHDKLDTLLAEEMHKLTVLEEDADRLTASLLKEFKACAAVNVQIRQLDGASKVWDYQIDVPSGTIAN